MRVKCENRRQAILDVAEQVFSEKGFELTSMSEITARVGGSKATLYNYFASKEDLFLEVMHRFAETAFEAFFEGLDSQKDMRTSMQQFGEQFLEYICRPEMVAALRVIYAESGRTDVGRRFYQLGPQDGAKKMATYLEKCRALGKLRSLDTNVAAQQFLSLLKAELMDPLLLGINDPLLLPPVKECVSRTVDMFLHAYAASGQTQT